MDLENYCTFSNTTTLSTILLFDSTIKYTTKLESKALEQVV